MIRVIRYISGLVFIFLLQSCVWFGEFYVGLTMQPDVNEEDFQPGINVFGILKAGDHLDQLNHRFEVQQLLNLSTGLTDTIEIRTAAIELIRFRDEGGQEVWHPEHHLEGIYFSDSLIVEPGEHWSYTCRYDTFRVTSSCFVPERPRLVSETMEITDQQINFQISNDTTAYVYDVYVLLEQGLVFDRFMANRSGSTAISLSLGSASAKPLEVYVFAYDLNFSCYFSDSDIFFKPNSFRPRFSAVENGYGVFGAVCGSRFEL